MSIDLKTIKHIAKLSRISIDDIKAKELEQDLNSIFISKKHWVVIKRIEVEENYKYFYQLLKAILLELLKY